jgi:hypothetical protein
MGGTEGCALPGDAKSGVILQETIVQGYKENGEVTGVSAEQVERHGGEARKFVHDERSSRKPMLMTTSSRHGEHLLASSICDEAGDSSDSPIDEWEKLYRDEHTHCPQKELSDVPWRKTRCEHDVGEGLVRESTGSDGSDEDRTPTPWSAVCIVGIRVYSEDDGLTLRTTLDS